MTLSDLAALIGALVAVVTLLVALIGLAWRGARWLIRANDTLDVVRGRLEHHTTSNGGDSLYDHASQAREAAEQALERVTQVAADLQALHAEKDRDHAEMWEQLARAGFDRRRLPSPPTTPDDGADGSV